MTEEKKQNLNKLIFIIFEIFSVISCITCILLIKVEEKQLLALLPLGFAVITLFFQKELMQDNIIILIIDALYFVRLSILPFLYSFNCDIQLFEGKEYVSSYINKSCILMLFEFLAIQITIYLHSHRKNNDKIKVKYINIKENKSKFLIIGLSAYIIIVYCFMPQ